MKEHAGEKFYIMVAHGGAPEEFSKLKKQLQEKYPQARDLLEAQIGAALSTYLGSGLLGAGVVFAEE